MNTENTFPDDGARLENRMKARADVCADVLKKVIDAVSAGTPADAFLSGYFRENRRFGARDRRLISEVVFAFLRWRGWADKADAENRHPLIWRILLSLAAEGFQADGIASVWCEQAAYPAERFEKTFTFQTPAERTEYFLNSAVEFFDSDVIPAWAMEQISREYRSGFTALLQKRAPMWLRLSKAEYAEKVRAEILKLCPAARVSVHPRIPCALKAENCRLNLISAEFYRNGQAEVQDFSSQCIGLAACPRPGENWLDLCAGGGGKTLFLASWMNGTGSVTASDIRDFKMREIEKRAHRAGLRNIHTVSYQKKLPASMRMKFDGVLTDVPCSSSGRWRRNPESRYILSPKDVSEITEVQREILAKAADAVRPGGVLVYGTCSVFHVENQDNVKWFLERFPAFHLEPFENPHTGEMTDGMLQTLPNDGDCDGSFVARFRRSLSQNDGKPIPSEMDSAK